MCLLQIWIFQNYLLSFFKIWYFPDFSLFHTSHLRCVISQLPLSGFAFGLRSVLNNCWLFSSFEINCLNLSSFLICSFLGFLFKICPSSDFALSNMSLPMSELCFSDFRFAGLLPLSLDCRCTAPPPPPPPPHHKSSDQHLIQVGFSQAWYLSVFTYGRNHQGTNKLNRNKRRDQWNPSDECYTTL